MTEYQIQPNTRRCTLTGRELMPGEKFYSVLLDEGGKFVRHDYSSEGWQGPPKEAYSFWCGRVPTSESNRRPRVDDDLLLDCFHRLDGQAEPRQIHFRYVVALLLLRRKRLKLEDSRSEGGQEFLRLRCLRTGTVYDIINPRLSEDEIMAVQEEVLKALGWE